MTPSSRTRASVSTGWKWSTSETAAPACSASPSTTFKPYTWKSGSTPSATSVAVDPQPGMRLHLLDVREQRAVREHRGLGRARGAGGEQQHREIGRVLRCELGGRAGRGETVDDDHRDFVLQDSSEDSSRRDRYWATARRARSAMRPDASTRRGSTASSSRRELVRRRPDVQRHRDRARRERPEVRGDERGLVPGDDRHPVARGRALGHRRGDGRRLAPRARRRSRRRAGQRDAVGFGRRRCRAAPSARFTVPEATRAAVRPTPRRRRLASEAESPGATSRSRKPGRAQSERRRKRVPAAVADVSGAGWEATLRGHPGYPEALTRPHPRPEPRSPARRPEGQGSPVEPASRRCPVRHRCAQGNDTTAWAP